ncbi:hypothetical protein WJX77_000906 [Trebouxia sp. C0004]
MAEEMELDPQLKALLEVANLLNNPGDDSGIPDEELRQQFSGAFGSVKSKVPVASISNRTIPGPDGNKIPIRIYYPADAKPRKSGLPILVFCHGGGFFGGDLNTHDDLCRNLGHLSAYITIAVDYRLAPEHKFPAGHLDCYAATKWAYDNASALGGDQTHVAVGGDSAGGSIAAAVCHLARDMKGPNLAMQVLLCPMTQPTAHYESESMNKLGTIAPVLSKRMCETAYERLVATLEEQRSELIDLNHAPSVKNLPPAYVVTAEYDPLRDEAEYYAARLFKNNVPTKAKRYGGAIHNFILFGSLAEIRCSVRALEDVAIAMRQAVKEEKDPWDARSYMMIAATVVAFLSVKMYHYYQTGNAL